MKVLITGVAGFIGSHLADYLIDKGYDVVGIDNLLTGSEDNINKKVNFIKADILDKNKILEIFQEVKPTYVFHEAAIARTLWTIENPGLAHEVNITGTFNMLMAALLVRPKKFIFASSNIVYAENTPYWVTKKTGEDYCQVFNNLYKLPTIALRYSNAYGSLRQSEQGPAINCIASLRKTKRDKGYVWITGDGKQTRDFTHVSDIARANLMAAKSKVTGTLDICTGVNTSMNDIAKYFDCPIKYVEERTGDVKHIYQDPKPAYKKLGFKTKIALNKDSLKPYL